MATITHKITLSTTDFNLVGDIKVRQADDETQVCDAVILEHGMIKNFEGLKPFFCLMAREITGQGVSEEPVTEYDGSKGTLKYTVSANAMQMVGRNEAYFSFREELSHGEWIEQFSTRSFYYTVERSIYTQPFKDSNYWWTFKELYRQFLEYQESGKKS
ncbi:phage baseplate upper protein [Enterococcus gallinarum]|uniref:phage baseplate upper protein n=1 Tax=Enterococcus gallinarum TaxID=1353 RepID=UPI0020A63C13|nr:phage baseplate upper protein [Enterococcus gallinarum]